MRQGGMKPKSHSNGNYWVRANAKGGGGKRKKTKTPQQVGIDTNGDGKVDTFVDVNSELLKREDERTFVDSNPYPLWQWGISLILVTLIIIWFFTTYP